MKRRLIISAVVFSALFIFTLVVIFIDGMNDKIYKSDVAIVLGSKVNPDGSLSKRLQARLDKAIELYQEQLAHYLIVSGGTGKEGINEAEAMKNYLVAHHVPASLVLMDSQGVNTSATAKNSARLMQTYQLKSAIVVSQYFHMTRTRLALSQCGIAPVYTAHAQYFEWRDLYSIIREELGLYYYLVHSACNKNLSKA